MLARRPLADQDEKREVELLLARCDLHEGLELPVTLPPPGELPDGGTPPFFWVEGGRIVGFLLLEGWPIPEGTPLVHPEFRRRGIGHALVVAAAAECRSLGLKRWLMVADSKGVSAPSFARAVGARYENAEYRMDLDRSALPPVPAGGGLTLDEVAPDRTEEFSRTLAEAFDDPLDQVRRWSAEQACLPNVRLLVAHREGEPVGTVRLITVGFHAYVTAVGVLPRYRRQGGGRWIVLKSVHDLLEEGWERVRIEVDTTNEAAYRLYRECGFRETRTYHFHELLANR